MSDEKQIFYLNAPAKIDLKAGRMKKDAISVGTWHYQGVDPETGRPREETIVVTPERIDHWVESLRGMRAAGMKIPMPIDHSGKSIDNVGFVEDLYRDGERMGMECEIVEVPNAALIGTAIQEVSVRVAKELKDGAGKIWKDVIEHISPCTEPVVPGQTNFIALRRTAGGFTPKGVTNLKAGGAKMDELMKLLQGDPMVALAKQAGVDLSDLTAENAVQKAIAIMTWCCTDDAAEGGDAGAGTGNLRRTQAAETPREADLRRRLEANEAELSQRREKDVDAEIDSFLKSGRIAAESAADVKAILIGGGTANLSRKDAKGVVAETSAAASLRNIIKALPEGAVVKLGKEKLREVPASRDGADLSRKQLADEAMELSRKEKISYADALKRLGEKEAAQQTS